MIRLLVLMAVVCPALAPAVTGAGHAPSTPEAVAETALLQAAAAGRAAIVA